MDWVWALADAEDTAILQQAFAGVLDVDDYLEAPDCSIGIAAAEVVAALRQRASVDLPEEVTQFVARIAAPPSEDLVAPALHVLERVRTNSELQELWDESDSHAEWHQAVIELESRLK